MDDLKKIEKDITHKKKESKTKNKKTKPNAKLPSDLEKEVKAIESKTKTKFNCVEENNNWICYDKKHHKFTRRDIDAIYNKLI